MGIIWGFIDVCHLRSFLFVFALQQPAAVYCIIVVENIIGGKKLVFYAPIPQCVDLEFFYPVLKGFGKISEFSVVDSP